jgi:Lhr-like helicase
MLEIKNFNIFKESYRAIWKDQIDVNAVNKLTYACNAQ